MPFDVSNSVNGRYKKNVLTKNVLPGRIQVQKRVLEIFRSLDLRSLAQVSKHPFNFL